MRIVEDTWIFARDDITGHHALKGIEEEAFSASTITFAFLSYLVIHSVWCPWLGGVFVVMEHLTNCEDFVQEILEVLGLLFFSKPLTL